MCIRDSFLPHAVFQTAYYRRPEKIYRPISQPVSAHLPGSCLLYTSDAADERSSVDLGGRRIIKKKKQLYKRMSDNA